MKIHYGVDSFPKLSNAVITTGTFDGVHLGHKKILNKLINLGQKNQAETVVLTFSPHPRIFLFPDNELKLINTAEENIKLLRSHGVNHVIFQTFDKSFSRISSLEYIRDILLKKIGLKDMVIGYNHHFGRNREGSVDNLHELSELYNFNIHSVGPCLLNDQSISSTKIRDGISKGNIELTNRFLGYRFTLTGLVVKGKGIGRGIGFPTANIRVQDQNKIIPLDGVYAVNIIYDKKIFKGMLNIGKNPTFSNTELSIEVHLFDFDQDIYNQLITLELVKRIRNEIKFSCVEDLQKQLQMDKITALNILD